MKILAWPGHEHAVHNPYQHLLYSAMRETGEVQVVEFSLSSALQLTKLDIFHVHWPDVFLAAKSRGPFGLRLFTLKFLATLAKARGARVIWTAHNLQRPGQRNSEELDRRFWPWWVRFIDGVIYLSNSSRVEAECRFPELANRHNTVIPHGDYRSVIGASGGGENAADTPPTALFFGPLKEYKRPSALVSAFSQVPDDSMQLVIAGATSPSEPDPRLTEALATVPERLQNHLVLRPERLSDKELIDVIRSSDLVVFPYDSVLSSGAMIFALSAGKPVLARKQPAFEELQKLVGDEFVWLYDGDLTSAKLLHYVRRAAAMRGLEIRPDLRALDWTRLGAKTVEFFVSICVSARASCGTDGGR